MFNFCPSCASKEITFEENKVLRCSGCGFIYYHNIAAATACLISVPSPDGAADGERLVFLIRGKEPAAGKLDLPGGFVDVGEGAYEGLYRELQEEIGWTPPVPDGENREETLARVFRLFASFSNVYTYKGVDYNTCDLFFSVSAPGLTPQDLRLEQAEIAGVRFLKPEEIDYDQLAFESTKRAVRSYLEHTVLD